MVKKILLLLLIVHFGCLNDGDIKRQNREKLPSVNRIKFNAGKNNIHFLSEGIKVAGHLYLPENYETSQKLPAIVIVGPRSSVKEQTQAIYAKKLSGEGFVALVFDHRTFGESDGEPRYYENPYMKVEDVKTAVSYIGSLDFVDKNKIGLLGICNGAGYAVAAAIYDKRVKAYASVSGLFDLRSLVISGNPDDKIKFSNMIKKSAEARQKYYETGKADYVLQISDIDENSNQLRKEAYDYYWTSRGKVPNYENKMVLFSLDTRISFDITDQINLLSPTPCLVITGTKSLTFGLNEKAYNKASEPKEFFKISDATHVDLYDIDKYVNQAVERLKMFYFNNLTREE